MPINMEGNLKHTSNYSSSPLALQNKDLSTASHTFLTKVKPILNLDLR